MVLAVLGEGGIDDEFPAACTATAPAAFFCILRFIPLCEGTPRTPGARAPTLGTPVLFHTCGDLFRQRGVDGTRLAATAQERCIVVYIYLSTRARRRDGSVKSKRQIRCPHLIPMGLHGMTRMTRIRKRKRKRMGPSERQGRTPWASFRDRHLEAILGNKRLTLRPGCQRAAQVRRGLGHAVRASSGSERLAGILHVTRKVCSLGERRTRQ